MPPAPARREFRCPACGRDTWLLKKPTYDGFTRTGETLHCALCHHQFSSEAEIPFKDSAPPRIFTEADRPRPVRVFDESEKNRMCRHCREYVVNPFIQRCGLHHCEVEATDTCTSFAPRPPPPPSPI